MGAFEDFVNANLGIRKPIITDSGLPSASSKAAGIIGSQYIDSDTYFLYEKTGENNTADWVKIGKVGQPRGQDPKGIDGSVQFNSGDSFAGSSNLTYDYLRGLLIGESGRFDYVNSDYVTGQTGHFEEEMIVGNPNLPSSEDVFVVDDGDIKAAGSAKFSGPITGPKMSANTGYFNQLTVSGDAHVSGDFYVSGTTYINEVIDTTVSGTISGHTGIFDDLSAINGAFSNSLTISGSPVLTGSNRNYPVLTGVEFNTATNIMSFFRDLGASNIDIDLSSLAGGGSTVYQSIVWWEEDVDGDLALLFDYTTTSNPATQWFEDSAPDAYTPREVLFSSTSQAAQFFEDLGSDVTLTTGSYLPPISVGSAVSTQWFEDIGGNEYSVRNASIDTTNPAVQLWEKDGTNSYMPRSSPYSSTTESAKYFEDDGLGNLNPTLN
jgi:hypothetical protein